MIRKFMEIILIDTFTEGARSESFVSIYLALVKSWLGAWPTDKQAAQISCWDNKAIESITKDSLMIILGSACNIDEDHSWLPCLKKKIQSHYTDGGKLLGVCFGHQLITDALGGSVVYREQGRKFGRHTYILKTANKNLKLYACHECQVAKLPHGAEPFLSAHDDMHAGYTIKNQVFCTQVHPEFNHAMMTQLAMNLQQPENIDGRVDSDVVLTMAINTIAI